MYSITEVKTKEQEEAFILLPVKLYKDTPYWIRPLDSDIRHVFDKDKNPCFKNGECVRWLLQDDKGEVIGRVAAFINGKTCRLDHYTVGQMGFFECINDEKAAFMLFDQCRKWLEEKGICHAPTKRCHLESWIQL